MMYLICLLPFLVELFGDWHLIQSGKKDIPWYVRVFMIMLVSGHYDVACDVLTINTTRMLLAIVPFCFFDPLLNVLRFGFQNWDKQAKTKWWDRMISHINPWVVLVVRIVLFIGLLWFAV